MGQPQPINSHFSSKELRIDSYYSSASPDEKEHVQEVHSVVTRVILRMQEPLSLSGEMWGVGDKD